MSSTVNSQQSMNPTIPLIEPSFLTNTDLYAQVLAETKHSTQYSTDNAAILIPFAKQNNIFSTPSRPPHISSFHDSNLLDLIWLSFLNETIKDDLQINVEKQMQIQSKSMSGPLSIFEINTHAYNTTLPSLSHHNPYSNSLIAFLQQSSQNQSQFQQQQPTPFFSLQNQSQQQSHPGYIIPSYQQYIKYLQSSSDSIPHTCTIRPNVYQTVSKLYPTLLSPTLYSSLISQSNGYVELTDIMHALKQLMFEQESIQFLNQFVDHRSRVSIIKIPSIIRHLLIELTPDDENERAFLSQSSDILQAYYLAASIRLYPNITQYITSNPIGFGNAVTNTTLDDLFLEDIHNKVSNYMTQRKIQLDNIENGNYDGFMTQFNNKQNNTTKRNIMPMTSKYGFHRREQSNNTNGDNDIHNLDPTLPVSGSTTTNSSLIFQSLSLLEKIETGWDIDPIETIKTTLSTRSTSTTTTTATTSTQLQSPPTQLEQEICDLITHQLQQSPKFNQFYTVIQNVLNLNTFNKIFAQIFAKHERKRGINLMRAYFITLVQHYSIEKERLQTLQPKSKDELLLDDYILWSNYKLLPKLHQPYIKLSTQNAIGYKVNQERIKQLKLTPIQLREQFFELKRREQTLDLTPIISSELIQSYNQIIQRDEQEQGKEQSFVLQHPGKLPPSISIQEILSSPHWRQLLTARSEKTLLSHILSIKGEKISSFSFHYIFYLYQEFNNDPYTKRCNGMSKEYFTQWVKQCPPKQIVDLLFERYGKKVQIINEIASNDIHTNNEHNMTQSIHSSQPTPKITKVAQTISVLPWSSFIRYIFATDYPYEENSILFWFNILDIGQNGIITPEQMMSYCQGTLLHINTAGPCKEMYNWFTTHPFYQRQTNHSNSNKINGINQQQQKVQKIHKQQPVIPITPVINQNKGNMNNNNGITTKSSTSTQYEQFLKRAENMLHIDDNDTKMIFPTTHEFNSVLLSNYSSYLDPNHSTRFNSINDDDNINNDYNNNTQQQLQLQLQHQLQPKPISIKNTIISDPTTIYHCTECYSFATLIMTFYTLIVAQISNNYTINNNINDDMNNYNPISSSPMVSLFNTNQYDITRQPILDFLDNSERYGIPCTKEGFIKEHFLNNPAAIRILYTICYPTADSLIDTLAESDTTPRNMFGYKINIKSNGEIENEHLLHSTLIPLSTFSSNNNNNNQQSIRNTDEIFPSTINPTTTHFAIPQHIFIQQYIQTPQLVELDEIVVPEQLGVLRVCAEIPID